MRIADIAAEASAATRGSQELLRARAGLDAINAEVRRIHDNALADRSKEIYRRCAAHFLVHLHSTDRAKLSDAFLGVVSRKLGGEVPLTVSCVMEILSADVDYAASEFPLNESFGVDDYERYLTGLRVRKTGKPLEPSTLNSNRSSLTYLFKRYNKRLPDTFEARLRNYMRGQKRESAKRKQDGIGKVHEGKQLLRFSMYRDLAKRLMLEGTRESLFAHTFLTISWNLMCRASRH